MMAGILTKAMPKMTRLFKKCEPPFIASLTESGNVVLRYDKEGSIHDREKAAKRNKANQDFSPI